jgi:ligand-binding sensor domain-containing protein
MKTTITIFLFLAGSMAFSQNFIKFERADFYSPVKNINTVFVDKDDNVYVGGSDQLLRYNGTKWDTLNIVNGLPGEVFAITQDNTDSIRFGVRNNYYYSTLDLNTINTTCPQLVNTWVNVLLTDSDGKIWAGTNGGISVIEGANVTNYTTSNGLAGSNVKDIKITSDGKVYIGTYFGISIYENGNWSYLNTDNGMESNQVTAIEFDGEGNLWIGTYDKGILKYDGVNWVTYNEANTNGALLFDEIKDLLWDGTRMWVAGFYFCKFENNIWTKYTSLDNGPTFPSHLDIDSQGNIWISSISAIVKCELNSSLISYNDFNESVFYPNPTKDFIYLSQSIVNANVSIYNLSGIVVKSNRLNSNVIDISDLMSGIYLIKVTYKNGLEITKKIIKE